MKENKTLLLNQSTIKELVDVKDINEIVHDTFKGLGDGSIVNPSKLTLDLGETGGYPAYDGFMNAMPAYIGSQDIAGMKWVGGFLGERKEADLPYITAMILLIDPHLGTFLSALEGAYITNKRTGAQTANSLRYLLDKPQVKIGLYGAGEQARTNIVAIADLFEITDLVVWNHRLKTAEIFAKEMQAYVTNPIEPTLDAQKASRMDVLITVTPSQKPLIKTEWVKPGTIVFPLGSFQEIEDDLIFKADKIIVDHVYQALNRGALKKLTSKGKLSEKNIYTTLGQLALKETTAGDLSNEITICIPIGTGAMDVAVAGIVYKRAVEKGLGKHFDFLG
ncbi:ornithine cyclodeaminase family protein [Lacticigenium naphthae]|uniref:ornithine cyclodeaminase family protein n=1 Tax=Lacticigenium naphthae TaxID=515351 RepID=UPI0003FD8DD1|nr:ornithine cyclodeaminase family protein [Lacticigenium naphthae]